MYRFQQKNCQPILNTQVIYYSMNKLTAVFCFFFFSAQHSQGFSKSTESSRADEGTISAKTVSNNKVLLSTAASSMSYSTVPSSTKPLDSNLSKTYAKTTADAKTSVNNTAFCSKEIHTVRASICSQDETILVQPKSSAIKADDINSFTKVKENLTTSQRCSPEEIERKKREALARKHNRLKLKKK